MSGLSEHDNIADIAALFGVANITVIRTVEPALQLLPFFHAFNLPNRTA